MKKTKTLLVFVLMVSAVLIFATGCQRQAAAPRLRLQVTAPAARATVAEPTVTVSGIVSESGATVTVMDTRIQTAADGAFSYDVPLKYGENRITVRATLADQTPVTRTLVVTRNLVLEVSSPIDLAKVDEDLVTVIGRVSDVAAKVLVNGTEVAVLDDGTFSAPVQLFYPTTTLNISTMLDGVAPITKMVTVSKPN